MTEMQLRAATCDAGRRLWQLSLGGGAVIAARLSPKRFLVTPLDASVGHLKPDELAVIDTKGAASGDIPVPPESNLIAFAFQQRADAEAIVLGKPAAATSIGLTGDALPDNALPEAANVLGSVPTVPFAMPGSEDGQEALGLYLQDHKAFLLAHNGAMVLGTSVFDAVRRFETLERISQTVLNARQLDGVRSLPNDAFNKLLSDSLKGGFD
ncbi:MAG: class II aldolase/adducin family protein [Fimbriimonadaceae bacterium]